MSRNNRNMRIHLLRSPVRHDQAPCRGGAIVVLLLFCLVAVLVFGLVLLNLCWLFDCREEVQSSADSAAITAAKALLFSQESSTSIRLGQENAGHYGINNESQKLVDNDFEFGRRGQNADGSLFFRAGIEPFNAVRVTARRGSGPTSSIPLFLGAILGRENVDLKQVAAATFADHDVAIVIDASGMMHGPGRFSGVKTAMDEILLVARRSPVDIRFSVTLFSKDAETVLPLTDNLARVAEIIEQVKLRGPRNLGAGMHVGMESLFDPATSRDDSKKSILILSECKGPKGIDPIAVAQIAKQNQVDVDIFTFTKIAGTALADQIAEESGGQHRHALDRSRLQQALEQFVLDVPIFLFE